jgi:hypothetical protein
MWGFPKTSVSLFTSGRLALLTATVLACPAPLYAAEAKTAAPVPGEILSPLGGWDVASGQLEVGPGQSMGYCAISNTYRDNGRLEFYGTEGKLAAIKIDFPGRAFRGDQTFDAKLRMPGGYTSTVRGSVVGTSTLILNVKGDEALSAALHNGKILYVGIEGQDYPFSLSGINKFNDRLKSCSSPGWGDLIHDYVFKKGPAYGPGDDTAIESETLKILASPPKSDPSITVEHIPADIPPQNFETPQAAPAFSAPAPMPAQAPLAAGAPQSPVAPVPLTRSRPIVPTPEASMQPPAPDMPDTAQLDSPRGKILARASDTDSPPLAQPQPLAGQSKPQPRFDELFTGIPPAAVSSPANPPQLAMPPVQEPYQPPYQPPPGASPAQPHPMAAPAPVAAMPSPQAVQGQISASPAPLWRALKGSSLREVLALWSLDNHVELIWNAEEQYRVRDTLNLNSSYENAVETLLKQFEPDFLSPGVRRPVGQLYVDPVQKKKTLVIRSQAG